MRWKKQEKKTSKKESMKEKMAERPKQFSIYAQTRSWGEEGISMIG